MAEEVLYVTAPAVEQRELPEWVTVWALMLEYVRKKGLLAAAAEHIRLERERGYVFEDLLAFALAFFCWRRHAGGRRGIKRFCREVEEHGWGPQLAAIARRKSWPTSGSVSRMLASVTRPMGALFRERVLGQVVAFSKLPVHWSTVFHDAMGDWFVVFDLDGIVKAMRRRALPRGAQLPEAKRGASTMGVPGYPGRKRSDVQVSSDRLQHAGSGQWLGQESVPGNTTMSAALPAAVAWLMEFCTTVNLPPQRVVVRVDGAAGHAGCVQCVRAAGLRVLVRWVHYEALEQSQVRASMQDEVWYAVPSSGSGPQRHAAELGPCLWLPENDASGAPPLRLVVSRFDSAQRGKKRGAGVVLGVAQYELYATDLAAGALPAEDAVALYYARAGHENSLARANEELGIQDTFSESFAGQDVTVQVGLLAWNLAIELGAKVAGLPERPLWPTAYRDPRLACRLPWGIDEPVPTQARQAPHDKAEPPRSDGETAPAPASPAPAAVLPAQPAPATVVPELQPAPADSGDLSTRILAVGVPAATGATEPSSGAAEVTSALPTGNGPAALPAVAPALSADDGGKTAAVNAWLADRPGWSWADDRGLICPAGHALCLRRRKLRRDEQLWFFRANVSTCPTCPQRSGCTSSPQPTFRRECILRMPLGIPTPGAVIGRPVELRPSTIPAPLLPVATALAVGSPRTVTPTSWTPPPHSEPGPHAVSYPALVPAVLRQGLYSACANVVVRVQVTHAAAPPQPAPHLAPTRSAHQHRRHTWDERRAWNALPPGTQVRVEFLGGTAIKVLLDDDQPAAKVA